MKCANNIETDRVRWIRVEQLSEFVLKECCFKFIKTHWLLHKNGLKSWKNVESINIVHQKSVQSSTYQKWISNTIKFLRRRMAPPCCVFVSWITLRKAELMFTLRVEPYYICMELVNGCYSVCWERLLQVLELSIHFFLACFFSHPEFIGFNAIDLIVLRGLFCGGVGFFGGFVFFLFFVGFFFFAFTV